MVAMVASGAYDCAVADISITSAREAIVAFSAPYYVDNVQLAVRSPLIKPASLFRFLDPFSPTLWVTYLSLALTCGILLFLFERGHNSELTLIARVSGMDGRDSHR